MKSFGVLVIVFIISFIGCNMKTHQDEIKEIEIIQGNFQTYYLKSKKYIVQYMNGKSDFITIDFNESQIRKIIHNYYENEIDGLGKNITLDDIKNGEQIIMPPEETFYIVHFLNGRSQKIYLRKVSKTSPLEFYKNRKIAQFLIPLNELLDSIIKAEKLPHSDFLQM